MCAKKNKVTEIFYFKAGGNAQSASHKFLNAAAVYRYGAGDYKVLEKTGGKPFFAGHPEICFSISHSGDYWMCAFDEQEVGLDIQQIRECSRKKLAERFFHPEEQEYLANDGYKSFFDVWAAKEAYLKYTGNGIVHGMDRESVVRNGRIVENIGEVYLREIDFCDRYKVWVCSTQLGDLKMTDLEGLVF